MLVTIWPIYLYHREQWAQIMSGLGAPLPKFLKCPKRGRWGRLQSQVSSLMEKHKSRHKSGLNSHAKRRGEVPHPLHAPYAAPRTSSAGKGGWEEEQKWTLGPGYQHAEVHSDPRDRLDAL